MNVLTIAQQGKMAQLACEARRMKLDILELCGVRLPNFEEDMSTVGTGIGLYSSIRDDNASPPEHALQLLSYLARRISWRSSSRRQLMEKSLLPDLKTRVCSIIII